MRGHPKWIYGLSFFKGLTKSGGGFSNSYITDEIICPPSLVDKLVYISPFILCFPPIGHELISFYCQFCGNSQKLLAVSSFVGVPPHS